MGDEVFPRHLCYRFQWHSHATLCHSPIPAAVCPQWNQQESNLSEKWGVMPGDWANAPRWVMANLPFSSHRLHQHFVPLGSELWPRRVISKLLISLVPPGSWAARSAFVRPWDGYPVQALLAAGALAGSPLELLGVQDACSVKGMGTRWSCWMQQLPRPFSVVACHLLSSAPS